MRTIIGLIIVCIVGIVVYDYMQKDTLVTTPLSVVAFGDSLTAGDGVASSDSYPAILEKALREQGVESIEIVNAGVSGDTTGDALNRLNAIISRNPDIVLLGFGANDMLRKYPPADIQKNLEALVSELQKNNINVVLLGMKANILMGSAYKNEFDVVYENVATKYNIPLVPYMLKDVALKPELNNADRIHPNKQGYEVVVYENILPTLLPFLRKTFE